MLDLSGKAGYKASTSTRNAEPADPKWGLVPPDRYQHTYETLPPVSNEDRSLLFANGVATHNVPLVMQKSQEMLDGIHTFDARFLEFLRELVGELNDAFTPELDENKFSLNGIQASFDKIRCVSGYPQTPMSYTMVNNASYRESLGLTAGYTPRQFKIAEETWRVVFACAKVTSINVPKLSGGGMRRFSHDVQWKLAIAEWLLEPGNIERVLTLIEKGDLLTLANEFEIVIATYYQKRGQVDNIGKDREVFDLDYALSNGARGVRDKADKRVIIDGKLWEDFSAMRMRVIHAGPWAINCILQIVATTTMQALFDRFPKTFHVNTDEEIKEGTNGKYLMVTDVTEYDRSMSKDAVEVPHYIMKEKWDERLSTASRRLYFSAYYAKPLRPNKPGEKQKGVWVGDPLAADDQVFAGNRSGHAMTSLVAKVNKVIDTLIVIDLIYPVLGRVKEFLEHKMPMGVINNGDDEITWAFNESDMVKFRALRADLKTGHYKVEAEVGAGYSGRLLVKTGPTSYNPMPRLQTPFEKLWVHERSIGGLHRPYYPIGITTRIEDLTKTENGRRAWDIHMRVYRKMMSPHFGDFTSILMRATSRMQFKMPFDSFSWADKAVLEDRDKIHYKVRPEDVSPEVMEKSFAKIPPSVVGRFLQRFYKGVLL